MAGDWIKMRVDLATSPKVVRIASALRADRLRVIGGLHAVWCLFDVHSVDGIMSGYTPEAMDELVGFPGLSAAMASVGWLEIDAESLKTPRFDEHNGQSAKRRAMETERKRDARKASAVDADKKRSREEKRREDSNNTLPSEETQASELTRTELWASGKSLLESQGMAKAQCGSFVGKLVKDYGDEVVVDAVRTAVVERPADAASFIKAVCMRANGERRKSGKHTGFASMNYRDGVSEDGTFV
jgi:hypothetical protein